MYNDVVITSAARGGSKLDGTFDSAPNSKAAVLFSHNSSGSKDESVIISLQDYLFKTGLTTFRYNFHFVHRIPVDEATFEDVILDIDAAYTYLMSRVSVPNIFLVGKSLGGVVSMDYMIRSGVRCPIIVLGFYEPSVTKYVTEARLKDLKSPLLVLHGENDQRAQMEQVRTILGRNRLNYKLYGIKNASHGLASVDLSTRTNEDIMDEIKYRVADFLNEVTL